MLPVGVCVCVLCCNCVFVTRAVSVCYLYVCVLHVCTVGVCVLRVDDVGVCIPCGCCRYVLPVGVCYL